jgi:hypothetical protein
MCHSYLLYSSVFDGARLFNITLTSRHLHLTDRMSWWCCYSRSDRCVVETTTVQILVRWNFCYLMMNDDVYECITLAYVWLVDPNYTKYINVRRSLREKIITIYVTMNRSMLICINYRVKNRYLMYRHVTLRNGHVRENKSIYRVYHVEWNSVITALLRSDEWCGPSVLSPANLVFKKHCEKSVAAQNCVVVRSACPCHVTNTLAVTITNFDFSILLPKRT